MESMSSCRPSTSEWMFKLNSLRKGFPSAGILVPSGVYLFFVNFRIYDSIAKSILGIDDAQIFFVYAENFRDGLGFRYSRDIPVTEGFSSPLWMVISVVSFIFRLDELGVLLVVAILQCLILVNLWKILCSYFNRTESSLLYFCWLFSILLSSSFWTWNGLTLMENALVTFWQLVALRYTIERTESKLSHAIMLLAASLRIEVFLVIFLQICISFFFPGHNEEVKIKIRHIGSLCLGLLFISIVRIIAYGEFFPNTYYAKISPDLNYRISSGQQYLNDYWTREFGVWVVSIFFLGAVTSLVTWLFGRFKVNNKRYSDKAQEVEAKKRKISKSSLSHVNQSLDYPKSRAKNELMVYCLFSFLGASLMVILKGGDHFKGFRLFSSSLPLQILGVLSFGFVISSSLQHVLEKKIKLSGFSITIAFVMVFGLTFSNIPSINRISNMKSSVADNFNSRNVLADEFEIAFESSNYKILEGIRLKYDPKFSIGIITGGVAGRNFKGRIYDLTGLNYGPIAHNGGRRIGFYGHSALEFSDFKNLDIDFIPDKSPGSIDFFLKGLTRQELFNSNYSFGKLCLEESQCVSGYLNKKLSNLPFSEESTFSPETLSWSTISINELPSSDQDSECSELADILIGVVTGRNLLEAEPISVVGVIQVRERSTIAKVLMGESADYLCSGYLNLLNSKSIGVLFYSSKGMLRFRIEGLQWQT